VTTRRSGGGSTGEFGQIDTEQALEEPVGTFLCPGCRTEQFPQPDSYRVGELNHGSYAPGLPDHEMNGWHVLFDDYMEASRLATLLHTIVFGVPIAAYGLPLYCGLAVLMGKAGWSRAAKNIVGPAVLVFGWIVAVFVDFYWGKFLGWAFG